MLATCPCHLPAITHPVQLQLQLQLSRWDLLSYDGPQIYIGALCSDHGMGPAAAAAAAATLGECFFCARPPPPGRNIVTDTTVRIWRLGTLMVTKLETTRVVMPFTQASGVGSCLLRAITSLVTLSLHCTCCSSALCAGDASSSIIAVHDAAAISRLGDPNIWT